MLMSKLVNREEIARRVAITGGYTKGEMEEVIKTIEDVIEEAIENGETVKFGKLYKLFLHDLPYKKCWDNLNQRYVIREPKKVPKFELLSRLKKIEIPIKKEEQND
ncbi:DNA binding protein [Bacillus phage AvesoBmore]|uniref:DNA binding protein n=3 Tax=Bequatrovirus TaxID=1917990 RepID=A0A0K2D1P5_9CAUD|nr:DNA binding protein [Bacillus phage AvesoBmore]ALA13526.1 DNA binding protein [Bacillus phage AvesoBmore]